MEKKEIAVYILIACGSLLMISYLPHMFLDGIVSEETKSNITIGVTIAWAAGLGVLGYDIAKKRRHK